MHIQQNHRFLQQNQTSIKLLRSKFAKQEYMLEYNLFWINFMLAVFVNCISIILGSILGLLFSSKIKSKKSLLKLLFCEILGKCVFWLNSYKKFYSLKVNRFYKKGNATSEVMRMNKRNQKRSGLNKEKASVIAASVFVLSALTLTGVYMAAQNNSKTEENRIDFAQLEQQQNKVKTEENLVADERFTRDDYTELSKNNDMDVDPNYMEVNSGEVQNDRYSLIMQDEEIIQESEIAAQAPVAEAGDEAKKIVQTPSFRDGDTLQWPIVGEVLLNYSMDKAIYFSTMQQYRYNPSVVIAAKEGDTITAAADATVKKIYHDVQTGNTVLFDLGDGYELTYGQLTDITLEEGQQVKAGDVVGKVAEPTIFYSVEGSNVYFKMTKDGEPVNPLEMVE